MRMYFRTDYYSYVATIDTFVQLKMVTHTKCSQIWMNITLL